MGIRRILETSNGLLIPKSKNQKPVRHSGVELLRLIAMLFVVIQHINAFEFLNPTNASLAVNNPIFTTLRFLIESIVIVGVNSFVLISGWFGIKATLRGFIKLVFQIVFIYIFAYTVLVVLGQRPLSLRHIIGSMSLGYWFVHSYLILYILSPIINIFIDNISKRQYQLLLMAFFAYQTIYGWLNPVSEPIAMGYSPISFIGLYLIARYLRIYGSQIVTLSVTKKFIILIVPLILNTILAQVFAITNHGARCEWVYYYCSPLVIVQSCALLMIFVNLHIRSKLINWIAGSCFAVYLLHMHPMIVDSFFGYVGEIWNNYFAFDRIIRFIVLIVVVYFVSILLDKLRVLTWNLVENIYNKLAVKNGKH